MSKRDFYEVLGVERGASEAEVKKAYRRLAMKYHRTAIRMTRTPRINSMKPPKPTKCFRTPISVQLTISTAMPE